MNESYTITLTAEEKRLIENSLWSLYERERNYFEIFAAIEEKHYQELASECKAVYQQAHEMFLDFVVLEPSE